MTSDPLPDRPAQPFLPSRVVVLGCGDAFGSGGRHATAFHVQLGATRALVDCGPGAGPTMKRLGLDPHELDVVCLTHFHGDHFGGLPFLLRETQVVRPRERPLVVAGPPGVEGRILDATEMMLPGARARGFPFLSFVEWTAGTPQRIGDLTVTTAEGIHAPGSLPHAVRLEAAGRTFAYSGDTIWVEALVEIARGADLFVCEAFLPRGPSATHMTLDVLAGERPRLDCRRLVLTHLGAELLAQRDTIPFEVAEDGLVLEL
jgi:ribonuclease BN (tRNA processing enzyme)